MRASRALFCILLSWLLAGCPIGGDGGGGNSQPGPLTPQAALLGPAPGGSSTDTGPEVSVTVSGRVTFDRLPVGPNGLEATPVVRPAAFVTIEVVRYYFVDWVLASTTTDANGNYTVTFNTDISYYVRARSASGDDRVYFPEAQDSFIMGVSSPRHARTPSVQTIDLHASATARHNPAGAFAALETMQRLRAAAATSFPTLGPIDVFWANGDPRLDGWNMMPATNTTGATADGPNNRPAIFLRGGSNDDPLNTDHDEYDETVIAHEWASILQLTQSRDNNFGGPHAGEELIPTAAYSEGVVTAIGCALLGTSLYRDTLGFPGGATSVQFEFDCESGLIFGPPDPYRSEFRVTRVVWDILDGGTGSPPDIDGDPVAVDLADFFDSFTALRTRTGDYAVAWLASLLQQLIDDTRLTPAEADQLAAAAGGAFPPPGGTDEFPLPLVIGGPTETGALDAWSGMNPNPVLGPQANAVFRLEVAAAQPVQINVQNLVAGYAAASHRLELTVHSLDRLVHFFDFGDAQNKTAQLALAPGTYIVRVHHRPDTQGLSQSAPFSIAAQ